MKLTLSAGGGFTGQTQQHSIDLDSLDEATRQKLMEYITRQKNRPPANYNETWSLDDGREVLIDTRNLPPELEPLYTGMKAKLKF